ncbi:hypothetical protein ACPEIF_22705 [Streptomyces sp. NPDC012600]|uniref:hypothetical protein n=1 Tax=Streptomyces sp. NPDC012600 TaxID=3415005 RepID=UPI003C2CE696
MSDEKQPELTPAEQRVEDEKRVHGQVFLSDVALAARQAPDMGLLGGALRMLGNLSTGGRTSFEGHQLNTMIDLVQNSNPADLESAGQALWRARDAIRSAAAELDGHIDGVDWQGESGQAFRKWGKGLVAHAKKLEDFADTAGTQITVAGTGLASVRAAMPPRDSRAVPKKPDEVDLLKRVEGNPEYDAAVKVEKNRQEAINQINRLASFYAVSEATLAAQEPPRFDKGLGIDMPRPDSATYTPVAATSSPGAVTLGGSTTQGTPERSTVGSSAGLRASGDQTPLEALGPAPVLDRSTSTEINSVAAPATPTALTSTAPTAPAATSGPGPVGGTTPPPVAPSFGNPVPAGSSRVPGAPGATRHVGNAGGGLGRTSTPGASATVRSGAGPAVGRPSPMSSGGPSAIGRSVGGTQPPAAGQSGVMGGRPVAAQGGTAAPGASRTGQGNGIVGGTPQRTVSSPSSGTGGVRGVSPGTVIGGPGASQAGASAGRPGQRGAVTSGVNGVLGAPRGASGSGSKGFTSGGAGLVRGPSGRRKNDRKDEENTGSTRPDYLTEDEETWAARRRGAVPPVVE